jgi:hypothetical protein
MQLIGIQKVLGSNLGPETDYPVWDVLFFLNAYR